MASVIIDNIEITNNTDKENQHKHINASLEGFYDAFITFVHLQVKDQL